MSFKIFEGFAFEHKISKSNAKVSIHYRLIGLFSEDFDIFAANIFFAKKHSLIHVHFGNTFVSQKSKWMRLN